MQIFVFFVFCANAYRRVCLFVATVVTMTTEVAEAVPLPIYFGCLGFSTWLHAQREPHCIFTHAAYLFKKLRVALFSFLFTRSTRICAL